MHSKGLDVNPLWFTSPPQGQRRLLISSPMSRREEYEPHVGSMLLFVETIGGELMGFRPAKPICSKNRTKHYLFDLFEVPLASSISLPKGASELREILVEAFAAVTLELSRRTVQVVQFPSTRRTKPERKERIHVPARSNGPVGVPIAATA